ncbi:MAG: protein translocase subunit SecF [Deltaproteobacteria bacterium]|nr:protein translocase subunit SecF [Deltaproteobacteria bacterium]
MFQIVPDNINIDFMRANRVFAPLSVLLVALSVALTAVLGLNYGIDFLGGYEIQVKLAEPVSEARLREIVAPLNLGDVRVQRFGAVADNEYLVFVREHATLDEAQKAALKADFEALYGGGELPKWAVAESGENITVEFGTAVSEAQVREVVQRRGLALKRIMRSEREDRPEYAIELVSLADKVEAAVRDGLSVPAESQIVRRVEFVGPQVGAQLREQGILATVYALLFILLYIAVRFDLFFAPGAIIALVHDVAITVGAFALFRLEFNLQTIAALLPLVGYSINDTIIVYDRIRENVVRLRGRELTAMVNTSINQTLSRTIWTSGTTLFVTVALWVFGGETLRPFAIALTLGIVVGTYSSIQIASPIYIKLRAYAERRAQRAGERVAATGGQS